MKVFPYKMDKILRSPLEQFFLSTIKRCHALDISISKEKIFFSLKFTLWIKNNFIFYTHIFIILHVDIKNEFLFLILFFKLALTTTFQHEKRNKKGKNKIQNEVRVGLFFFFLFFFREPLEPLSDTKESDDFKTQSTKRGLEFREKAVHYQREAASKALCELGKFNVTG